MKGKYNNVKKCEWLINSIIYVYYKYVILVVIWVKLVSVEELIFIVGINFLL